ncbi:hypothetical protein P154DRAFT_475038 [Amniculicola lignicola CBS 123094]|uniref:P-loop containing nucleoside triphosphate hydrolase protein n=1 Tax=Amniculicola lignicola CBS 123094 TaxID=1392246 RepID=A0A6A5VZT3_9PLEO|nr:hypothetical protein P154DRAFT_475038 [Amniculicola lignicola CBS 123094]
MGLGKSLVMISTIAGSLDRAEFFRDAGSQSFAASPSQKVRTKATLVVAPSSLLIDSWVDEIRKHTYTGAMSFHRHIGSTRHTETNCLQTSMIVFTTYATIAMELSRGINSLPQLHWFRIVLDEAHDIRNKATKQYHAISNLSAEHRWCLTGTPIQNSLDDLGALIAFLKVPILEHAPAFRKFITTPILSESGRRKDRFKNLQLLLQTLCLRRTRELLDLPKPITQERRLQLSLQEQAEYREILQRCRSDIDMAVSGRGKAKVNSTVLESLLKLRLYCNNGMATNMQVTTLERLPADPDEILSLLQQMDRNVCAYCSGAIYSINPAADADGGLLLPNCKHMVCRTCMVQHRFHKQQCPTCASGGDDPMPGDSANFEAARYESPSHPIFYPTKLRSLFTDISREPLEKSIVFSSWKKTLTLFGKLLSHHDAHYAMIDGSLSLSERLKVLKDFRSPTGANMLLMTLGTGAVGLNLAVASRIYLLEPQWNPMIESQAIGRALRLGQTAQVVIVRYIMEDTVEESNVLSRQRTKLQLAGSGFGRSKEASSEQLQAMLNIFGIDSGI